MSNRNCRRSACRRQPLASALALVLSSGLAWPLAHAAAGPDPDPAAEAAAAEAQAPAAEGEAQREATVLEATIVTAQGREQELQRVPISLQVIDARLIEDTASVDIGDLDFFVPGLFVSDGSPTQPRYSIRGITTGDFGIGTDPAVGVYIDGVYAARTGGALLAFNDVERVEVLKGPQGTLFGRNAAAGAVSIVTRRPGSEFEGNARGRVGNDGQYYLDALLNVPINDSSAFRVSALTNQADGWLEDAATGEDLNPTDQWAARLGYRLDIGDSTQAVLTWDHEELDQLARPAIGIVPLEPYPYLPPVPTEPSTFLDPIDAPVFNDVVGNEESREFDGVTLTIDHTMEWATLTSITAWRGFDTVNREDEDGTNRINLYFDTANIEDNSSWYQEFRFAGATGSVDWLAGASYYSEDAEQTSETNAYTDSIDTVIRNVNPAPTLDGSLFGFLTAVLEANGLEAISLLGLPWQESMYNSADSSAFAVYGDAIWHLNDRTNLTFGLRYTHDRKKFTWLNGRRVTPQLDLTIAGLANAGFFDAIGVPPETLDFDVVFDVGALEGVEVESDDSWNDLSPRFVIDYALGDDAMWFASATKGYKAGGYNSVEINSYFDNEDVWNFETGIKSEFPDQRLVLNGSVYYYVYDNRQSIRLDPDSSGDGVPQYIVDTADEEAWGIDFEARWNPTEALTLFGNFAFIDAQFKDKIAPSGADLSGDPTGEPYLSSAIGGNYVWTLPGGSTLVFSALYGYRGAARCNSDSTTQGSCQVSPNFDVGESQGRTDARLGWTSAKGNWGVAMYGNNVFDDQYVGGVNNITASTFGTPFASITEPRRYGLEVWAGF